MVQKFRQHLCSFPLYKKYKLICQAWQIIPNWLFLSFSTRWQGQVKRNMWKWHSLDLNPIVIKISPLLGENLVFSMDMRHSSISIRLNTSHQSSVAFHFKVGTNCGRLSIFYTQIKLLYNLYMAYCPVNSA